MKRQLVVLACVIALTGACGGKNSKNKNKAMPQATPQSPAMSAGPGAAELAGTWELEIPGGQKGVAVITPTDATHVNLQAGGALSGSYLVQPPHLLILTHDEKLRPLAWQIISPDSMLLTRAPTVADVGSDYTGATLTRGRNPSGPTQ